VREAACSAHTQPLGVQPRLSKLWPVCLYEFTHPAALGAAAWRQDCGWTLCPSQPLAFSVGASPLQARVSWLAASPCHPLTCQPLARHARQRQAPRLGARAAATFHMARHVFGWHVLRVTERACPAPLGVAARSVLCSPSGHKGAALGAWSFMVSPRASRRACLRMRC